MATRGVTLPPALLRRGNRVVRPRDASQLYVNPRAEFARLARQGALLPLATGYFVIVPADRIGDPRWRPELDAVGLGVAQADYGQADTALAGTSAARHHGALPRALALATVAVPKQRPVLASTLGPVKFSRRDVRHLDIERVVTSLGTGWVTTVEQTLLDLVVRPYSTPLTESDLNAVLRALGARTDWDRLAQLARDQHRPAALRTAQRMAA